MLDRSVVRFGAAGGMVGAVIALVFNILHPRSSDVGAASSAANAQSEGIWLFDHYMIGWAIGLALLAFIVISKSMTGEPSRSWATVAMYFSFGSVVMLFASLVVDGFSVFHAGEASAELGEAMAYVSEGLFVGGISTFFGVLPVLYGEAVLTGDDYPKWLGWMAVAAGLLGLVTATMMWFDGLTDTTSNVMFPVASVAFTVWIGSMSFLLWQKTGMAAEAGADAA
ncbi:MAG: hypothetical protein R3249_04725 [Nitriliruptorales bacterium]|nr:hypothetical protein [Nitriliruptorales bacterium]